MGFWPSCFVFGWFLFLFRCGLLGLCFGLMVVLAWDGGLVLGVFGGFVAFWAVLAIWWVWVGSLVDCVFCDFLRYVWLWMLVRFGLGLLPEFACL